MIKEIFNLRRFDDSAGIVTPGVLFHLKMPILVTLEHPWKGNQPFISSIPLGEYLLKRYSSQKYPLVWEVCDVKNRDRVLLHWGNFLKDTQGCILLGEKFSDINGDGIVDIGESKNIAKEGFNEFMERTKDCGDGEVKLIIEHS